MPTKSFTVRHGCIRLRITMRDTVRDVHKAYLACHNGVKPRGDKTVVAYFWPTLSLSAKHVGGIVLPMTGEDLNELIPHEVAHAVIHAHQGVLPHDDEAVATAIGVLCARIAKRVKQMQAEAL